MDARLKPKLKKFMQNIYWEQEFRETAFYDYFDAWFDGFDLKKYSFADECFIHTTKSMDRLYQFNTEMIRRKTWNGPF